VDPYPTNENITQMKTISEKYFKKVEIRYGSKIGDHLHGVPELIKKVKNDFFFIMPGGRTWHGEKFSILKMYKKLKNEDKNVVEICMFCDKKNIYRDYLLDPCVLFRTSFIKKKILPNYSPFLCWEYQLREIGLLENVKSRNYELNDNPHKYYGGTYFSQNFKKKKNIFFGNISTDDEIKKIIDENGEWHQIIFEKYKNNKNVSKKVLENFKKKINNKKWIYRWTGVRTYVPNTKYYLRHY